MYVLRVVGWKVFDKDSLEYVEIGSPAWAGGISMHPTVESATKFKTASAAARALGKALSDWSNERTIEEWLQGIKVEEYEGEVRDDEKILD